MRSDAVIWQQQEGPLRRGKLELGARALLLSGSDDEGRAVAVTIPYADVRGVRLGQREHERLQGRRSLVLEPLGVPPILVTTVGTPGTMLEVLDLISSLVASSAAAATRVAVVVPLRSGAGERARQLIERGPPFDPDLFDRHHVYLTEREVVFVFEGPDVRTSLHRLIRSPALWRKASEWRSLLAGTPRAADEEYSWTNRSMARAAAASG